MKLVVVGQRPLSVLCLHHAHIPARINEDYRHGLTLAVPQQTVGDSVEPSGPQFMTDQTTR